MNLLLKVPWHIEAPNDGDICEQHSPQQTKEGYLVTPTTGSEQQEPITTIQRLFENVWFLLLLGTVVPTLMYTVWGLVELVVLPQFHP